MTSDLSRVGPQREVSCPITLRLDLVAGMLNLEFADHPVYDGAELQWFDDEIHGTGMLAFLSRRGSRQVDYYLQAGLRLDRGGYEIGGGIGHWDEADFDVARLDITDDGVDAEVRFTDVDGRLVELHVDDRDGRPRRPGGLLAPIGAGIERPVSLMLVWMPRFDLVRATGAQPVIRIDGADVATGRLPGARLHRRHLIKYAAPLVIAELNRSEAEPPPGSVRQQLHMDRTGKVREVSAEHAGHRASMHLDPPLPDMAQLADGSTESGRWHIEVDGHRLTGGTWSTARRGEDVNLELDVDERWAPGPLPGLMRVVTTVAPVFRRWPTTYRWRADVHLGRAPTTSARWERTGR